MNALARFVAERGQLAWAIVLGMALLAGSLAAILVEQRQHQERYSLLETDVERLSIEIMAQTLNGNVMGALGLVGMIDREIKRESRGELTGKAVGERVVAGKSKAVTVSDINIATMESLGRSFDTEGAFLVTAEGLIGSAWYSNGKPSFGSNVRFRPYYQMALQGVQNVYAAVGTGQGERMLYFSAPVYAENTNATDVIGAVVARVGLHKVDHLLRENADVALLLSPQKLVFASSRPDWVAMIAGQASPEQLKAIREIRQFGDLFDSKAPISLPIDAIPGLRDLNGKPYALTTAKVDWHDPLGDWTLVMMEDLSRSVPVSARWYIGLVVAALILVMGGLLLRMWQGQHAQFLASDEVARYAHVRQQEGERKAQLAAAGVQMQQAQSLESLLHAYFVSARELVGALQGACYGVDPAVRGQLALVASYACKQALPETLAFGEGLLGQCAVDRRVIVVETDTEHFADIRSGLGEAAPAAMLLAPVQRNEVLLGVIEIALLRKPSAGDREQFDALTSLLAMNIEIVRRSQDTERQLSEIRVADRLQTERLSFQQTLVDTIPYPVFFKDADARFVGFNRAYEDTFGVRREDLIGKRVLDLEYLPEGDRIAYQAEDEATIASAGKVRHEMKIPFADGKIHDTLYFVSGFRQEDGRPGGLVGTFIDISELRQAEEELQRLRREHGAGLDQAAAGVQSGGIAPGDHS